MICCSHTVYCLSALWKCSTTKELALAALHFTHFFTHISNVKTFVLIAWTSPSPPPQKKPGGNFFVNMTNMNKLQEQSLQWHIKLSHCWKINVLVGMDCQMLAKHSMVLIHNLIKFHISANFHLKKKNILWLFFCFQHIQHYFWLLV